MYDMKIVYINETVEDFKNITDYSYDEDVSITLNIDCYNQVDIMLHQIRKVYIKEYKK